MASKKQKSNVDRQIDENLKRVYEDTLKEELPDRFLDLLAQLKEKEGSKSDGA
ncbi:NepR family anti-sigma factor [Tropicimonas sp. S265A]|uniref:NepR family anti-sigma factor n=1 Tax=Tropicimonas sp. S265A TaxID=3415134 RepID=UPI003C7A3A0F